MLAGELYQDTGPELVADALNADRLLRAYNATGLDDPARPDLLGQLLGGLGRNVTVRSPFHCDYGSNIRLGDNVFINFACVFLDVTPITIGADCRIGPMVQLYTADHPRDPTLRRDGYESGIPITIGSNVWIGGGAIILPGVTIGDDAIVGAGSVVTRDVPPGGMVAGNPARPRRRSTSAH